MWHEHVTQKTADIAAASSASLASMTWIAELNEFMQLIATLVAVVAGVGAAWWHFERAINARKERVHGLRTSDQSRGESSPSSKE